MAGRESCRRRSRDPLQWVGLDHPLRPPSLPPGSDWVRRGDRRWGRGSPACPGTEYIVRIGRIDDRAVLLRGDRVIDIAHASGGRFGDDPMAPFRSWPAFLDWAAGVEDADEPLAGRTLQNPIPQPTQVFAVGANYRAHLLEAGASEENMPTEPLIFTKFPSCLVGPTDPIPIPNGTIDWEVELVVVIGVRAEHVRAEDAWGHVAGLTVGQDISDRTMQFVGLAPQFSMSKSYPGFGPLGPSVVTVEEFADPDDLELGCTLDGEDRR